MQKKNVKKTLSDIKSYNAGAAGELRPRGETAVCSRCKNEFYSQNMFACPHPAVQKKYGNAICYYCCRKCKYGEVVKTGVGGVRCKYREMLNEKEKT